MIYLIALGAFLATLCGGFFALKFSDKLHLVLGFSAGALIGVAFFDLLPESLRLAESVGRNPATITLVVACGFAVYMILDRFFVMHGHGHENSLSQARGKLGAGSLSFHSFLDGAAIGLAFQVSAAVGIVVAVAVLVHDFSDGINTVNLVLKNNGERNSAMKWLTLDAVAPVLGVIVTQFFRLPESDLAIILALFCGFFFYIGASDLLPESHHGHPTKLTTFMTVLGLLVLYIAVRFAG